MAIATDLVDDNVARRRDDRRQSLFRRINRSAPYLGAFGLGFLVPLMPALAVVVAPRAGAPLS